ncbi:hypothetical protein P3S68_003288 [Capsicum galapagoense]
MEIFNISRLRIVDLSFNNLSGSLPQNLGSLLPNIEEIYMSFDNLVGTIPHYISNCSELTILDLSYNKHASRSLPNCFGNITSRREIHLGSNKLSSNIPASIGNLQDLVVHDLSSNNMVGSLPPEIGNLKAATLIDLSMNQFSNGIPREIGGLRTLLHLSLRHNKLQGSIPDSLSNMVGLEVLDVSHNNISGIIPISLEKLQNLKYFNLSVNKLYGEIPSGGPFENFSSNFFIYNEALCGSSRFSVPPCLTSSKHKSNRKKLLVLYLFLGLTILFVPIIFVFVWIRYGRGKRAPQQADSFESNLIGSGSFGSIYEGVLRSGISISVKVFNLQLDAAFKSFDTECEVLLFVFAQLLRRHQAETKHNDRCGMCICSSPVIHCDMKPSNVLLDEDMVAHLSDFGISKLLDEDQGDLYTKTLATLGHIAPEYGLEGLLSTKCDVHSYGVMLLETFTRRKPNGFEVDLSLKQWVSYSLPDAVMDIVDANLVTQMGSRLPMELDVVASIMKVALDCCAESLARRTNMKDVVGMLRQINIQLLVC